MKGKAASGAWILTAAVLAAGLGISSSHAEEPTTWQGTIALPKLVGADQESLEYSQEGCVGSHPDGTFNAFIDVRAYQGRTLRFISGGSDQAVGSSPGWFIQTGDLCKITGPAGTRLTPGDSMDWTNANPFIAIYFSQPAYNAHYTVQVL